MLEFLAAAEMRPYSIALGLFFGLLGLELVSLLFGGTILGSDADAPDIDAPDIDAEFDADLGLDPDIATEISLDESGSTVPRVGGLSAWLGIGEVLFAIWIAALLVSFGLTGFIVQSSLNTAFDWMLPVTLSVPLAVPPTVLLVRIISSWIARIVPKTETTAVSRRAFGGQHGVITQGTMRRGSPAEVRLKDRHGNVHYLRVEPMEDDVVLPQGTEVYITRKRDGRLRAMEISLDT